MACLKTNTPDENRAAGVCCHALYVQSWQSDRRYFVLSEPFVSQFAAWLTSQGIALDWQPMEAPVDLAAFDRYEAALTHLAAALGLPWQIGESALPILEEAAHALTGKWQP